MNKAITDGLILMPPAFENGLDVWSSEDGPVGSATYEGAANAAFVPADQDFAGCLEMAKTDTVQKLRYMGQTPLFPGCYIRVRTRVKALSGNLPDVRIAAWAGGAGDVHVTGVLETGPSTTLTTYGEVVTIDAIIGAGSRGGVDMVWGTTPIYAHIGLDLTGANGGVVRIDDIEVEDVTAVFHRQLMDWVDVRDYGALGDGTTDDTAAFEAADAAAAGREVLVSAGTYFLADHVTFESPARFEGLVNMPADKRLALTRNFDLPAYADAFGDEVEGFKRAMAVLFNFSDHESFDLKGRRIELDAPIDVQAAVNNKDTFDTRRVIRNGTFEAQNSTNWNPDVETSQATYATSNPLQLTAVDNVANVPVGALIEGLGVGREVYVRSKDISAGTVTLSKPFYDGAGTQIFTFRRFKYILDFSGFKSLKRFNIDGIDFDCSGDSSGVMLSEGGRQNHFRDCHITKPKDRGITSIGDGCQGLLVDRCQFNSNEQSLRAQDRTTIGLNVNANDAKLRANLAVRFAHFAVLGGTGNIISDNHFFQGDNETLGIRQAGIVLTQSNVKTVVTGNYVDNAAIEWTNEHDDDPDFSSEFGFGGLSMSGNIFMASDMAPWFRWITVKPYGSGHFINGMNVSGNTFKCINGRVDRVEQVDTTFANLDFARMRNIIFEGNSFHGIDQVCMNPVTLGFDENSAQTTWTCSFAGFLPFGGRLRNVSSVVAEERITTGSGTTVATMPYVVVAQGTNKDEARLTWNQASLGRVIMTGRMDNPT